MPTSHTSPLQVWIEISVNESGRRVEATRGRDPTCVRVESDCAKKFMRLALLRFAPTKESWYEAVEAAVNWQRATYNSFSLMLNR